MNRREFIKLVAAGVVATTIPLPELGQKPTVLFDPTKEYGNGLMGPLKGKLAEWRGFLITDARSILPRDTPFEILLDISSDYGLRHQMAWYYSPKLHKFIKIWNPNQAHFDANRGIFLFGGYLA